MVHYCLMHGVLFGDYRNHMDEHHDGRTDCVGNVSTLAQVGRLLDGESYAAVCCVR